VNSIDKPFAAPPGAYPPATQTWIYTSTTVPPGFGEFIVGWQPGTPLGILVPVQWQVSDILFRVENTSSVGNSTVQIARYTGVDGFSTTNFLNDTPIVILPNKHECTGRPFTQATINNPIVNSGDKLQPVFSLGIGASEVTMMVKLVQYPGV
jgi:hypothetical protein